MLLSCHQNAGQNRDIKIVKRSFGMRVTNQNLIQEEIKRRLSSGKCLLPFGPELFTQPLTEMSTRSIKIIITSAFLGVVKHHHLRNVYTEVTRYTLHFLTASTEHDPSAHNIT
jgi:hypothetical protein